MGWPLTFERYDMTIERQDLQMMEAHPLRGDERDAVAEMFARGFAEELWCAALVEVLPDCGEQHAFLLGTCKTDMEGFAAWGGAFVVSVADSPAGLILVGSKDALDGSTLEDLNKRAFEAGCEGLPPQSRERLEKRLRHMEVLVNGHWMERFCEGDFRYIYAICVDAAHRKTGVFGRLIDPVIAECDRLGVPLCLECYTERLASLYGNRGFEVVDTINAPALGLTEYCMVRTPRMRESQGG
jgi:GNAT superfamily N-acetyltransferase